MQRAPAMMQESRVSRCLNQRAMRMRLSISGAAIFWALWTTNVGNAQTSAPELLTSKAAMGDWTTDAPGVRRRIIVDDLPPLGSNVLAVNFPRVVARPANAQLHVLAGFKIDIYASGL